MEEELRILLLKLLEETYLSFLQLDATRLRIVSDKALQNIELNQDPFSINLTITVYSLAKIVEWRHHYKAKPWALFQKHIKKHLLFAQRFLSEKNTQKYKKSMKAIIQHLADLESSFKYFITEVITRAKVKKGTLVYERGLSVGRAAALMGISSWELMEFIGQTRLEGAGPFTTMPIIKRMKFA